MYVVDATSVRSALCLSSHPSVLRKIFLVTLPSALKFLFSFVYTTPSVWFPNCSLISRKIYLRCLVHKVWPDVYKRQVRVCYIQMRSDFACMYTFYIIIINIKIFYKKIFGLFYEYNVSIVFNYHRQIYIKN